MAFDTVKFLSWRFREVPVRLRRPEVQAAEGQPPTFGDARSANLYGSSELWRVYRVVDELLASKAQGAGHSCGVSFRRKQTERVGNGPNTVSGSTVSNTELSEFFGAH